MRPLDYSDSLINLVRVRFVAHFTDTSCLVLDYLHGAASTHYGKIIALVAVLIILLLLRLFAFHVLQTNLGCDSLLSLVPRTHICIDDGHVLQILPLLTSFSKLWILLNSSACLCFYLPILSLSPRRIL